MRLLRYPASQLSKQFPASDKDQYAMIATLEDIDLQSEFGSRVSGIKLEIEQRSVRICGTARSQYIKQLLQQRLADRYGSVRIQNEVVVISD